MHVSRHTGVQACKQAYRHTKVHIVMYFIQTMAKSGLIFLATFPFTVISTDNKHEQLYAQNYGVSIHIISACLFYGKR
jgi:hypothetical protein